jgi:hypothetical protein
MEDAMISQQLKTRTTKEAGRPLIAAAAVNIDTHGPSGAPGECGPTTPRNNAWAQLVEALTGFDRFGMRVSPRAYLRNEHKPFSNSERNDAALAAVAVLEAAEIAERVARNRLEAATTDTAGLMGLVIRASKIQSLMLEVVRTLIRSITRAESPVAVAALVFQAKYLAGMFSRGAAPLDPENDAEVADCLARRSMQQAA